MLKKMFLGLLFAVFALCPLISGIDFHVTKAVDYSSSGTSVGGYISENTTWTLEGSPYIVVEDVVVEPNISLTIDPGVIIRFQNGKNLVVDGFLYAKGNSTHRILFTSNLENPNPGAWGTIMLRRQESKHLMEWVIVEYAEKGIHIKFGLVTIRNSIFQWNNIGLYASDAGNIEVRETLIINNALSGVHTDWPDCSLYLDKVKVLSNGVGLDLYGGHFGMNDSIIARNKGFGIYLPRGAFSNIYVYNSTVSENLGYGIYAQGWCWHPTYIIGCTITHNALSGIYREAGQWGVYVYNSTISKNRDSGVRGFVHAISYNNVFENSPYDYKNEELGDVNATYNWWGTTNETQIRGHIYDYYDDYNLGRVIFKPLLSEPTTVPDNIAPLIDRPTQLPLPNKVKQSDNVKVAVNVTDYESGVKNVTLWYTLINGTEWAYTTMLYNESLGLYEGTIPGQLAGTWVKYKIVAYDFAGNMAIEDNLGEHYTYQVQTVVYKLTITATTGGTTDPKPGNYTYINGTVVSVTAIPDANYRFGYWILDGTYAGSNNPIEVLMDSNHTLKAVFAQLTYQLTISTTTGGTTNPSPGTYTYINGTLVSVTAIPNSGFSFDYWLFDWKVINENPITVLMNENHTLEAYFVDNIPPTTTDNYDGLWHKSDFTITLTAVDYGSGVAETYYRINNGPVKRVSVDGYPLITSESSNNTLEYWSVDVAGNEEIPHKILFEIKLDKTPPLVTAHSRFPEDNVEPDQSVKITVNVTDNLSGVKDVKLSYRVSGELVWHNITMTLNQTTMLYEATIQIQQPNVNVEYKIMAYDNAGNLIVEDNNGEYYAYTVIPEFSSSLVLLTLITLLTIFAIMLKKRKSELRG